MDSVVNESLHLFLWLGHGADIVSTEDAINSIFHAEEDSDAMLLDECVCALRLIARSGALI